MRKKKRYGRSRDNSIYIRDAEEEEGEVEEDRLFGEKDFGKICVCFDHSMTKKKNLTILAHCLS